MKTRITRAAALGGIAAAAALGILAASGSGQTTPSDGLTANRFVLTIDGYTIGTFNRLAGIVSEVEATEYWQTDGDDVGLNKVPGKVRPPTITLKRPAGRSLEMAAWFDAVRQGEMANARRNATLTMYGSDGKPVARYSLVNAWPSRVSVTGTHTTAGEVLTETVVLTAEYFERVAP